MVCAYTPLWLIDAHVDYEQILEFCRTMSPTLQDYDADGVRDHILLRRQVFVNRALCCAGVANDA